jgi:hypothetical protein
MAYENLSSKNYADSGGGDGMAGLTLKIRQLDESEAFTIVISVSTLKASISFCRRLEFLLDNNLCPLVDV